MTKKTEILCIQIMQHPEVRVSTTNGTFVFTDKGFHMATGRRCTINELREVADLIRKWSPSYHGVDVINVTFKNYQIELL